MVEKMSKRLTIITFPAGYTIVRILQKFEKVQRYWSDADAGLKSEIVLSPSNGVKVGFFEAEKN